ncbi:MAG: hypothetical protein ACRCZB_08575, partial [Bacteroidales bacterium]
IYIGSFVDNSSELFIYREGRIPTKYALGGEYSSFLGSYKAKKRERCCNILFCCTYKQSVLYWLDNEGESV